jgi:hypothetical protein
VERVTDHTAGPQNEGDGRSMVDRHAPSLRR